MTKADRLDHLVLLHIFKHLFIFVVIFSRNFSLPISEIFAMQN